MHGRSNRKPTAETIARSAINPTPSADLQQRCSNPRDLREDRSVGSSRATEAIARAAPYWLTRETIEQQRDPSHPLRTRCGEDADEDTDEATDDVGMAQSARRLSVASFRVSPNGG